MVASRIASIGGNAPVDIFMTNFRSVSGSGTRLNGQIRKLFPVSGLLAYKFILTCYTPIPSDIKEYIGVKWHQKGNICSFNDVSQVAHDHTVYVIQFARDLGVYLVGGVSLAFSGFKLCIYRYCWWRLRRYWGNHATIIPVSMKYLGGCGKPTSALPRQNKTCSHMRRIIVEQLEFHCFS